MPVDKRTEEERWDDCLSGEHVYEPGEVPDYMRDWVERELGVELPKPERPAR